VRGDPVARQAWAVEQVKLAARASANLGLKTAVSFSGALAWPFLYPFPQRPPGLIEEAFAELARRWRPILDVYDAHGVDLAYEIHPSEDLHDGVTFERFLEAVGGHPRANILYDPSHFVLQHLDYLAFLDIYRDRIRAVHIKDAELRYDGRSGVYGGYQAWIDRPGRFRSLGDGQVDFKAIFSRLAAMDFDGWAVLEWECCLKHPEDGAREGAAFIRDHIIRVADRAFDDFAAAGSDPALNRAVLGI
jgi:sugar phosphate isomerase/epimerase